MTSSRRDSRRYTDFIVATPLDAAPLAPRHAAPSGPSAGPEAQSKDPSSMTLRIHNTLSRRVEVFEPIVPGQVRMYVCGMTIYDLCHMGHARMMMAFDVVYRWLLRAGLPGDLCAQHHRHRRQDHQARAGARHHHPPAHRRDDRGHAQGHRRARHPAADARAARHRLRAADAGPDRHARSARAWPTGRQRRRLLRGAQVPGLRQAVGQALDELRAGARVAVVDGKRDPLDFALWKAAKPGEPDDASGAAPAARAGRAGTSSARR